MNFILHWKRLRLGEAEPFVWIRLAALAVWLAAAGVLGKAAVRQREAPERIRNRLGELSVLDRQEGAVRQWLEAKEAFLRSHSGATPDAANVGALAEYLGGSGTNGLGEARRTALDSGWEAVRVGIQRDSVPLASLSPFIEAAESANPPWRLARILVEPSSPKPGLGRVEVELERLLRSER